MSRKQKVSNEKKNLSRLAGEFLVASRLTQRGYMVTLQWGTTIGYDILVFDKEGKVAFLEVKFTASNPQRWILQSKYARPENDTIPLAKRFICCVDLSSASAEPVVYVFPAKVVADGMSYFYKGKYSKSDSYMFPLNKSPKGSGKNSGIPTVGQKIGADYYINNFSLLGVATVVQ